MKKEWPRSQKIQQSLCHANTRRAWEVGAAGTPSGPADLKPSPHSRPFDCSCYGPTFLSLPPEQNHPFGEKGWEDKPKEESAPRKLSLCSQEQESCKGTILGASHPTPLGATSPKHAFQCQEGGTFQSGKPPPPQKNRKSHVVSRTLSS